MGDLTSHFSLSEFACREGCDVEQPVPPARLLAVLEVLRHIKGGRPLQIVSGFRCLRHNDAVGGAFASRHMDADAADILSGYCTVAEAEAAGAIGIGESAGWAIHVDVRPGAPARWSY